MAKHLIKSTSKRYHVKRITDGAYADLRVQADKSVQLLWVCNVRDAYTTVERSRAQQIAALLDVAAYPTFGKIIIEEAQ